MDKRKYHQAWVARRDVPMPMLEDTDHAVSGAFGVWRGRLLGIKQATFLMDPDGRVRGVYPTTRAKGHAAEVLRGCREVWETDQHAAGSGT